MSRSPRAILIASFLLLVSVLSIAAWVHYHVLLARDSYSEALLLERAYWVNAVAAILIIVVIYLLRKRMFSQIGFLFLAGSMLKFVLFFLLFHPAFKADGVVSRPEFMGFFIPYCLSLIIETLAVSELLKVNPGSDH